MITYTEQVPELDVSDRMLISLRKSGLGVSDMAKELKVSRGTISNWINGRIVPKATMLPHWSAKTGVSLDWLMDGLTVTVRHQGLEPRTR